MSLVDVVDEVLDELERDERLRFTLDGQLATVDDYLEIRPEAEERIRRLVQSGRLAIGPWQTLVDEFLVDGETIVRNLETGLARAAELGGTMRVGYLPDMFGHVAQMPQILRSAGIETAVVWRGVPSAVGFHRFVWESPDGSSVVAEYLPDGYGNAAHV
jgi:mannosylglycerate hydrolase